MKRASLMPLDHPPQRLHQLFRDRPATPFFKSDLLALREVALEILAQPVRQRGALSRQVYLIIQAERAVVEVGRADDAPDLIDDQDLRVVHCRSVFRDLDAAFEEVS